MCGKTGNREGVEMVGKALYLMAKFDEETQNTLTSYYNVLYRNGYVGSQTKNIPYHITLGSHSIDTENQTIDKLEKICSATTSFEINLAHIGLFGLDVLFISPAMNFELLKLQQSFFPDYGSGYHTWIAHTTMLIDEPNNTIKALAILTDEFKPFRARIECVELYEFFPTRYIKSCRLKDILHSECSTINAE